MDIGLGAGPLLSSSLCWALDVSSVGGRAAAPAFFTAVSWALLTITLWAILPPTFGQLQSKDAAVVARFQMIKGAALSEECAANLSARQRLWMAALIFGCERALV